MNGPEHYTTAENLLDGAANADFGSQKETYCLRAAQVHATLALAAAVGGLDAHEGPGGGSATGRTARDAAEWDDVTYAEAAL